MSLATIPPGYRLFVRAASIVPTTDEHVHFQLWNRGHLPIILWHWSAMSLQGTTVAAGPTGSGDPNQSPLVGMTRLVNDITAYTYSYAEGVDGSAGDATGLETGPASALSLHGEMRAQVTTTCWLLAQAYIGYATGPALQVDAQRGLIIPPGHGWTVRASVPRADLAVSFAWLEPVG